MQRISLATFAVTLFSTTVFAHPSITSGPTAANQSGQKITIGLSHGCGTSDTTKLTLHIPAGLTSVKPIYNEFGPPSITKVGANVATVTWTKTDAALDVDFAFYEFTIRARVADAPFTQILIPVTQTCADGTIVEWDQPPGSTTGEPAMVLKVVPKRDTPTGWSKFTLTTAVAAADFGTFFGDALIVWRGTEAFSSNPTTMTQIGTTTGVTALATDLAVGDEILVKY